MTARLWRTARPHRLVLSGGGITAAAVGTVYSLAVGAGGPAVGVVEGTVEVRGVDGLHLVHAGSTWPPVGHAADPADARVLLALPAPVAAPIEPADAGVDAPVSPGDDTPAADDATSDATDDAGNDAAVAVPHPAAIAPAIKDRWRTARLLRGQGQFAAAITECLAIADARDPTWSPIALVEAARIELDPLADPERAIALADRAPRMAGRRAGLRGARAAVPCAAPARTRRRVRVRAAAVTSRRADRQGGTAARPEPARLGVTRIVTAQLIRGVARGGRARRPEPPTWPADPRRRAHR